MAPDRQFQLDTADADGRYEITFEKGTGDYLVHISAIGRTAFRKRVTRTGSDSVFAVDAALRSNVQVLAPVAVSARRARPARETGSMRVPGTGAAEQAPDGVNGNIAPDALGAFDAMAGALPGVTPVAGGVSVLGLAPAQNSVTLNGLEFSGGGVPRGASTSMRVATSQYDPARGGFSGAQTQVTIGPGNVTDTRRAFLTIDAPPMQAGDATANRSGSKFTSIDVDLGGDGGTNLDRWMYNYGAKYRRRFSDAVSLVDADADLLQHSGVSSDSVSRLITALGALGVPVSTTGIPSQRVTDHLNLMARLDRPLFDYASFTPKNTSWGVLGYANWTHRGATTVSPTLTPASDGESTQLNAGGQWIYSRYFGALKDQLTEVRSGVSVTDNRDDPYLRLPNGRVLVSSGFADGTSGVASLGFAGNSALQRRSSTIAWQTTSETQFFWRGRARHPGKIYAESRLETFSEDLPANRLGTYHFNSLADLQANQPASFSRTINAPSRSGGEWTGALAASDNWTPSNRFNLLFGARLEGNRYTATPAANPQVESAFGEATDRAPNTWHVSPRVGFNWLATRNASRAGSGATFNQLGQFVTLARGVLRGGIGEFRQRPEAMLLADAMTSTGLPTGAQRISCVGPATPPPDWSNWLAGTAPVPSACVGAPTAAFSDAAPTVRLFAGDYQPARSWRSNLSWGSDFKRHIYSMDAIYSINLNQRSSIDLNFAGTPRFALANEGGRPVYVPHSSIVASTGAVSPTAARSDAAFGPVLRAQSDLRGWSRQARVRVRPRIPFRYFLDVSYTLTQSRSQARGFDGAAGGDPRAVEWARSEYTPAHEIYVQGGLQTSWVTITSTGKVSSGMPYTPVVGSDINGDGFANDRAFVFGPAAADPALATDMQTLLSTSDGARECLASQVGRIASRASCVAPWSTTLNLTLSPGFQVMRKLKLNRHGVSLNITNPLAGLDQLLHGSDLRGWGAPAYPDRVLYYVRGYDSTTQRFSYEVNPRFGDTRPRATAWRAPFRVTLDIRVNYGRDGEAQQIDRLLLPGRRGNPGARLDSAAIVRRYCGNLPDWYNDIFVLTDSLLLTRDQVDALRSSRVDYSKRLMTHWGGWAGEMSNQPDRWDTRDLLKRQNEVILGAWRLAWEEAQNSLPKILTPVQLRLLGGNARMLHQARQPPTGIRYFSSAPC